MAKKNRKLKDKVLEQSYTIEALDDEIEYLKNTISESHNRIVELIGENDRLTITYEPYIPEGDEYHGLEFFELIEENEELGAEIMALQMENRELRDHIYMLQRTLQVNPEIKTKEPKAGIVSLDFWPPSDWKRFKLYRWNPGRALQAVVGPLRFDWFAN